MAITAANITILRRDFPGMKAGGVGVRQRLVLINGDGAIAGGGSVLTAALFQLNAIDSMLIALPYPLVNRKYIFDKTNLKLQAQVAAGTEFTGDASADRIIALVTGR
jgi:hypothetical protein